MVLKKDSQKELKSDVAVHQAEIKDLDLTENVAAISESQLEATEV